jgi:hypothetical protein
MDTKGQATTLKRLRPPLTHMSACAWAPRPAKDDVTHLASPQLIGTARPRPPHAVNFASPPSMRQRYEFFSPIWRVMRDDNVTVDDVAQQVGGEAARVAGGRGVSARRWASR